MSDLGFLTSEKHARYISKPTPSFGPLRTSSLNKLTKDDGFTESFSRTQAISTPKRTRSTEYLTRIERFIRTESRQIVRNPHGDLYRTTSTPRIDQRLADMDSEQKPPYSVPTDRPPHSFGGFDSDLPSRGSVEQEGSTSRREPSSMDDEQYESSFSKKDFSSTAPSWSRSSDNVTVESSTSTKKQRHPYDGRTTTPSLISVNISEPSSFTFRKLQYSNNDDRNVPMVRNENGRTPTDLRAPQTGDTSNFGFTPKSILKPSSSLLTNDESDLSASFSKGDDNWRDECGEDTSISSLLEGESTVSRVHLGSKDTANMSESEERTLRVMRENLERQRERSQSVDPSQFHRGEARMDNISSGRESEHDYDTVRYVGKKLEETQKLSRSEAQMKQLPTRSITPNTDDVDRNVIIWPPLPDHVRQRPKSAMARSITDPDRIDEYRRQKQLELESMKRHERENLFYNQKQAVAKQIQEQQYFERNKEFLSTSPTYSPTIVHVRAPSRQQHLLTPEQTSGSVDSPVRVFETRPISSISEATDPREFSASPATWQRTYLVDPVHPVAKNEIVNSDELLERDQYNIDLLKRREAFVEKPTPQPDIYRIGRRWQPPPDTPYSWPSGSRPASTEPGFGSDSTYGRGGEMMGEHRWEPVIHEPKFKTEHKNFTPTDTPPDSPIRGYGPGTLDEAAKRQLRYLIQPSPDGSHRPKAAFGGPRQTPSGGFYPHAPNAIKIIRTKHTETMDSPSPRRPDYEEDDVRILRQNHYHSVEDLRSSSSRRNTSRPSSTSQNVVSYPRRAQSSNRESYRQMEEWDKIYELPVHSSTITGKDTPTNVDVKRRLAAFETDIRRKGGMITRSIDTPPKFPQPHSSIVRHESGTPLQYFARSEVVPSSGARNPISLEVPNQKSSRLKGAQQGLLPNKPARSGATLASAHHLAHVPSRQLGWPKPEQKRSRVPVHPDSTTHPHLPSPIVHQYRRQESVEKSSAHRRPIIQDSSSRSTRRVLPERRPQPQRSRSDLPLRATYYNEMSAQDLYSASSESSSRQGFHKNSLAESRQSLSVSPAVKRHW